LLKLHLQQSKNAASQKNFWFSHKKMKSVIAMKNLKFSASSMQSKDDATLKFNKFKQNVASFNFTCWSCKKLRHKIDNLIYFNYAFRQKTCNHDEKIKKRKSDIHHWIIKYNYEKMIITCIDNINIDKCFWENAWSSLSY